MGSPNSIKPILPGAYYEVVGPVEYDVPAVLSSNRSKADSIAFRDRCIAAAKPPLPDGSYQVFEVTITKKLIE